MGEIFHRSANRTFICSGRNNLNLENVFLFEESAMEAGTREAIGLLLPFAAHQLYRWLQLKAQRMPLTARGNLPLRQTTGAATSKTRRSRKSSSERPTRSAHWWRVRRLSSTFVS